MSTTTNFGAAHLVEHVGLDGGAEIGEQHEGRIAIGGGQLRQELLQHAELGGDGAAVVHVDFVFAGPMERLAIGDFQPREVNAVTAVKVEVAFREIPAHDADEVDGREETGGDGGVTGGPAEQSRVAGLGGFDGVKRGGTDNHYAHNKIK